MSELFAPLLNAPFALLLATAPLICYLVGLALVRVAGMTLIMSGGWDVMLLALAVAGLFAVGPVELFFPAAAAALFGPRIWIALALFYLLCATLIALTSRPKLVVYGRTPEELFDPLVRAAKRIDADAVGDPSQLLVHLPSAGMHLRLDGQRGIDYANVLMFEALPPHGFWSKFARALREEVAALPAPTPRRGIGMLLVSLLLGALLIWHGIDQQALVVDGFREWLWR